MNVDPIGLVRGRGMSEGMSDQYVDDRPYAATSFLSVALNRVLRTAMTEVSREQPELAAAALPLELRVTPLPARGGDALVRSLFEPLGWNVALDRIDGPRLTPEEAIERPIRLNDMRIDAVLGALREAGPASGRSRLRRRQAAGCTAPRAQIHADRRA